MQIQGAYLHPSVPRESTFGIDGRENGLGCDVHETVLYSCGIDMEWLTISYGR